MHALRAIIISFLLSTLAEAHAESFDRFTAELPRALEADAVVVLVRGITYDAAGKLCVMRRDQAGQEAFAAGVAWRAKNDLFFKAAGSVINEFGDLYFANGGEKAKQEYFQAIARATAKEAQQQISSRMNGVNPEKGVFPEAGLCHALAGMLLDGTADIARAPEITRFLLPYMQKKGIK